MNRFEFQHLMDDDEAEYVHLKSLSGVYENQLYQMRQRINRLIYTGAVEMIGTLKDLSRIVSADDVLSVLVEGSSDPIRIDEARQQKNRDPDLAMLVITRSATEEEIARCRRFWPQYVKCLIHKRSIDVRLEELSETSSSTDPSVLKDRTASSASISTLEATGKIEQYTPYISTDIEGSVKIRVLGPNCVVQVPPGPDQENIVHQIQQHNKLMKQ